MNVTGFRFFRFIAVIYILYYAVPKKWQWIVLLASSVYFYSFCGFRATLLLLCSALLSYGCALLITKYRHKRLLLASCCAIFLIWLLLMRLPLTGIIIPAGLSFFSLQCMGYCIEVYRQNTDAERNPLKLILYIAYFPHVLQGPFADFNELRTQLFAPHSLDYEDSVKALYRIAYGIMKKVVIADRLAYMLDQPLFTGEDSYGITVLLLMILYALQLYADFSGYMDILLGVSQLFGIRLRENFNVPYASRSMAEFWRRWHISLGLYFRTYVFFPLLRSRPLYTLQRSLKQKNLRYLSRVLPVCIALAINWTLIGIWHGFGANYLIYDWICGGFIILAEVLRPVYDRVNNRAPKIFHSRAMDKLRTLRTFLLLCISLQFFRSEDVTVALRLVRHLFAKPALFETAQFIYWNIYDFFLLIVPVLLLCIVDGTRFYGKDIRSMLRKLPVLPRWLIYICGILLIWITREDKGSVGFAYAIF